MPELRTIGRAVSSVALLSFGVVLVVIAAYAAIAAGSFILPAFRNPLMWGATVGGFALFGATTRQQRPSLPLA